MTSPAQPHSFCPLCLETFQDASLVFCSIDGGRLRPIEELGAQWIGKIVQDKYRIERFLGAGGMAEVYEAVHTQIHRRVAIKLLLPKLASDPTAVERFKQEARLVSLIGHPNVVGVEDFGTLADGTLFMVMDLLEGKSLEDALAGEPIDTILALDIAHQVCDGLQAAHDRSIVHRDIKPANIFLHAVEGESDTVKVVVKVLDLGIAKLQDPNSQSSLTVVGTVFGTPEYMAPEQAMGEAVDHRADIYSLGVVVYHILTGQVPFAAESFVGVLTKHLTQSPAWPVQIARARKLPDEAEEVVMKALAKHRDHRYQSVQEFQSQLASLRMQIASTARTDPPPRSQHPMPQIVIPRRRPSGVHRVPLEAATGADREVVEIAPDVFWVGRRYGGLLECNGYLRVYRGDHTQMAMLIDPGPPRDLEVVASKVSAIIGSLAHVDLVFLNHQDPDLAGNAALIQQLSPRLHILCSEDTWRLVQFYGLKPNSCSAVEHFRRNRTRLATGHPITFVPTPFCHFRGAVMLYDPSSRVLFSGDLFGGLSRSSGLISREEDWPDIDIFHQLYMPSTKALHNAVRAIRSLEPKPTLIAPQHGSVIQSHQIEPLLERIESLEVGIELTDGGLDRNLYVVAVNHAVSRLIEIVGAPRTREVLRRFATDGTFPNLFVFAGELEIEDIKIQPRAAIQALLRDVHAMAEPEQRPTIARAIDEAFASYGISLSESSEDPWEPTHVVIDISD